MVPMRMRCGTIAIVLFVVLLLVLCAESKSSRGGSGGSRGGSGGSRGKPSHQTASRRGNDKHTTHRRKHDSSSEEDSRHAGKRNYKDNFKKHSTEQFLKHEKQTGGDGKSNKNKHSGRHKSSLSASSRNKTTLDSGKHSHSSFQKHNTSRNSSPGFGEDRQNNQDVKPNSTHNYGWNLGKLQNSFQVLDSMHGTKQNDKHNWTRNYGWNVKNNTSNHGWNSGKHQNYSQGLDSFHGNNQQQVKQNSTNSYGWKTGGVGELPPPPYGWNVPNVTNPNLGSGSLNYGDDYSRQFHSSPIVHSFDSQSDGQKTHLGTSQRQTYTNIGWNVNDRAANGSIYASTNRAAAVSSYFDRSSQVGFVPNTLNGQTQFQPYDNYKQSSNYLVKCKEKKKKTKKNKFDISLEDFSFEDLGIDKPDLKDLLTETGKKLTGKLISHSSKLPTRRIYSTKFPKYNRGFDLKPFSLNGSLFNFTDISKIAYINPPSVPKMLAGLETTYRGALIRDKRHFSEEEQRLIKIMNDFMAKEKAWNEARIRERRDVEGIIVTKDKINDKSRVGKDVTAVDNFKFGQVEALVDDVFDISVFAKLPKDKTKATTKENENEEDNISDKPDNDKRVDSAAISISDKQDIMPLHSSGKITKLYRVHETIDQFLKRRPLSIQTNLNQDGKTLDTQKESKDGEEHTHKSTDPSESGRLNATTIGSSSSIISNSAIHGLSSGNNSYENISHSLNSIILPPKFEGGEQVEEGVEISQHYNRTEEINTSNTATTPVFGSSGYSTGEFSEDETDTREGITVTGLTTGVGLIVTQVDDEGVKGPQEAASNIVNPIEHLGHTGVLYSVSTERTSDEVLYAKAITSEETKDYDEAVSSRNGSPAHMTSFSIVGIHRKSNYYLHPKRLRKMEAKGAAMVGEVLIAAPRKSVRCPRGSRLLRGRCRAVWGRY